MIPRAERLPMKNERRKPAYVFRTTCFTAKVFRPESPRSRFAIVVGKNVFRSAVKRNHLRRVVARMLRALYAANAPTDVLVIALPTAGRADEVKAVAELKAALHKS